MATERKKQQDRERMQRKRSEQVEKHKEALQVIRDLVLWINTKSKYLPEKDKINIWAYMKRKGIQGSVFRGDQPLDESKEMMRE